MICYTSTYWLDKAGIVIITGVAIVLLGNNVSSIITFDDSILFSEHNEYLADLHRISAIKSRFTVYFGKDISFFSPIN